MCLGLPHYLSTCDSLIVALGYGIQLNFIHCTIKINDEVDSME